jgi:hypothetical protein
MRIGRASLSKERSLYLAQACPEQFGCGDMLVAKEGFILLTFSLLCSRAVAVIAYMPSILQVCETRSDPSRETYSQWSVGSPDTHLETVLFTGWVTGRPGRPGGARPNTKYSIVHNRIGIGPACGAP